MGSAKNLLAKIGKRLAILIALGVLIIGTTVLAFYLLFNVGLKSQTLYLTNFIPYAIGGILWLGAAVWLIDFWTKKKEGSGKNGGLMNKKEFSKIGSMNYLPLASGDTPFEFYNEDKKQIEKKFTKGWILDSESKRGEVSYKHYTGCHMLVYGMSRSGKTSGYVLPTIFANAYSKDKPCFIVTDPKGELYELTAGVLKSQGYRIYKLDIINANHSNRINPLSDIWDAYQVYQSPVDDDVKYAAHQTLTDLVDDLMMALVPDDITKKGDDIWTVKGRDFWKMILYFNLDLSLLINSKQTKDKFTLLKLLEDFNSKNVEMWEEAIFQVEKQTNGKSMVSLYKSILTTGKDAKSTFESIKANASMAVSFISNASVIKLTSTTDVDLKNFDCQPTAIFIIIDNDRPNLKNITNIYLKKIIRAITSKQERGNNKNVRPIYLIGDEIGNIPPIHNLDGLLTTCLYKSIFCMLIFQDKQQLMDRYGKNGSVIANNCDLSVIVKVKNLEQAREWSGAFGTYTVKKTSQTKNADGKISKSTSEYEKEILSPSELLKLYPKILIWLAGYKPIICRRTPIYQTNWYKENVRVDKSEFVLENSKDDSAPDSKNPVIASETPLEAAKIENMVDDKDDCEISEQDIAEIITQVEKETQEAQKPKKTFSAKLKQNITEGEND